MKTLKLFLLIICSPILSFSQTSNVKTEDSNSSQIDKNIYRVIYTQPIDKDFETNGIIAFNYEHKIKNAFSITSKLGVATSVNKFGSSSDPYQISFHLFSSIEARYYFTLNRRLRKEKSVFNFSCPYISLEQNLFTNQFALINQTAKGAFEGYTATYFNLGYQKQISKLFFAAYAGGQLSVKDFSKYDKRRSLSAFHVGLTLGYVF